MNVPYTTSNSATSLKKFTSKQAAQNETSRQELRDAVNESNDILASATSFSLFPDTIVLDRTQLTITKQAFLQLADVMSMRIEDVLNVTATTGPVFGSLSVFSRIVNIEPRHINFLWRRDALRMKGIIQGYIVAVQREIDCSNMSTSELIKQLEQLDQSEQSI